MSASPRSTARVRNNHLRNVWPGIYEYSVDLVGQRESGPSRLMVKVRLDNCSVIANLSKLTNLSNLCLNPLLLQAETFNSRREGSFDIIAKNEKAQKANAD